MARYLNSGIPHSFSTPVDGTIHGLTEEVTAFVGRTLRGPVGVPVPIASFDEFVMCFGGLWSGSPLAYSVYLYFLNGGTSALVVRVTRNARAPSLELPSDDGTLILRAVDPGRHEAVRAAVDYDGIARTDVTRFNLTVQRVRGFESERVLAQEIYPAVSVDPSDDRFLGGQLGRSTIVTLRALPASRPRITRTVGEVSDELYRSAALDGDDGEAPGDHELLGGSARRDGLFALKDGPHFSQLYLPPPAFDSDVGAPVLRAAARICARRDAILLCDAPSRWRSVIDAEYGIRQFSLRSSNAAMYFPHFWISVPGHESRLVPPVGAVAGILARISREAGMGAAPAGHGVSARGIRLLAVNPGEQECYRLGRSGVNCLRVGRGGRRVLWDARTLVDEDDAAAAWQSLRVRRIALYLKRSIRKGLAFLAGRPNDQDLRGRVVEEVSTFLHSQFVAGLFRGGTPESAYRVRCDHGTNPPAVRAAGEVGLEFGFAPLAPGQFLNLRLRVPLGEGGQTSSGAG